MNLLNAATLLFEIHYKEDSKKNSSSTNASNSLPSNAGKRRKLGYDPSQQRGKDGRWIETGAENRTERRWNSAYKKLDKQKGIQAIQTTPTIAKQQQDTSLKTGRQFDESKIEKEWGVTDRKEINRISNEMDKVTEKWEEKNPDDPFGIYDDPEYEKLSNKLDKINEKFDRDPLRSRKLAFYNNLEEFESKSNLQIKPIHATVINDYMRGGYQDINKVLRNPEAFSDKPALNAAKRQAEMLSASLQNTPVYEGIVHRGTDKMALSAFDKLREGDTFIDKGFMSTNRIDRESKPWDAPIQLTIKSKTGRSIQEFGDFRYTKENKKEDEVLFLPNTPFKVKTRTEQNGKLLFELEEI